MAYSHAGFSRPTITDSMINTPRGPLTPPLRVALLCGAAVLCLPPSGFAAPRSDGRVGALSTVTTAVPEPSTLVLFGAGLLTAAAWTRKRFGVQTINR